MNETQPYCPEPTQPVLKERQIDQEWGETIAGYRDRLMAKAMTIVKKPELAEDLVSITITKALERRAQFDNAREVLPWLMTILANSARDHYKLKKNKGESLEDMQEERGFEVREESVPDAEKALAEADTVAKVRAALQELPERDRRVIELLDFDELSQVQAAAELGTTPAVLNGWYYRAKAKLRDKLNPEDLDLAA